MNENPHVVHSHNRDAWDRRARAGKTFTRPAKDDELAAALAQPDPQSWLPEGVRGKRLLCLAAGGGKQSAIYAAAGARVAVVDISSAMLELDRRVAEERQLDIQTVETSMDDLSMFGEGEFDVVVQPVSTCYTPDIGAVYRAVARVLRPGGVYISQHKQPASLQADVKSSPRGYELVEPYYRQGPLPAVAGSRHREEETLEFLHRWEQLLGGLCRCGFVIEDLVEPLHADEQAASGEFGHRSRYVAPYVRIKARRLGDRPASPIWTP